MRRSILAAIIGLLCLGCAAPSDDVVKASSDTQYMALVEEHGDIDRFGPQAFRILEKVFVIGLYGSSSCPPNPTGVSASGDQINVMLKASRGACTADYGGPFAFTITLADDMPMAQEWTILLDGDEDSAIPVVDIT